MSVAKALADLRAYCNREIKRLNTHATPSNGYKPAPDLHVTNEWLKRLDVIWQAVDAEASEKERL